jgi:DNA (cytosine-5)-methyltransferase 1
MAALYNEVDPYAAQWLRNLIAAGHLPAGEVDTRSIIDVRPDDLAGFTQCHFFAGIGGWALAARLAGWPDDRELWTGSCPCQPFSVIGRQEGVDDARHLWPDFLRLIAARRPVAVMGEQVASALGVDWLDGVRSDLERIDYASGTASLPACAVNAPHLRNRIYWVARDMGDADHKGLEGHARHVDGRAGWPGADRPVASTSGGDGSFWDGAEWLTGWDGKARRAPPGLRLLADGVPARVGRLRAYGNAVVPQLAAQVIGALMECEP